MSHESYAEQRSHYVRQRSTVRGLCTAIREMRFLLHWTRGEHYQLGLLLSIRNRHMADVHHHDDSINIYT